MNYHFCYYFSFFSNLFNKYLFFYWKLYFYGDWGLGMEVLVKLWQGYDSFQGKSDLRTWIYRVSLNTCISIDRKKKRRKTQPLLEGIDLFDKNDADNRQTDMLHERIGRLQPFDRAIVLLWLENMSYDEIAQIVGISVKNVSVKLYRIKEQLKQM